MLNEKMDEVVLVKGWKKSASWSFPRGKINKEETDLDCAIREVWEETGLDLDAAGLVPEDRKVHSVSLTMKQQNMVMFVFRGVPKDTMFEPRTRKEISKIEWYKLDDLPTFRKGKARVDDENGHHPGLSANKFYMVAPFLGPLRQWIKQQKKNRNRHSSNLAGPPIMAEESEVDVLPVHVQQRPQTGTDLPEVHQTRPTGFAYPQAVAAQISQPELPIEADHAPAHMPQVDTAKSNALLSLLRSKPAAEMRASPQTPLEQPSFQPQETSPSRRVSPSLQPQVGFPLPPQHSGKSFIPMGPLEHYPQPYSGGARDMASDPYQRGSLALGNPSMHAQYQNNGTGRGPFQHSPSPPRGHGLASNGMPGLNNHQQSLLGAFMGGAGNPPPPPLPSAPLQLNNHRQNLLDAFRSPSLPSIPPAQVSPDARPMAPKAALDETFGQLHATERTVQPKPPPSAIDTVAASKAGLLQLFSGPSSKASERPSNRSPSRAVPVELATTPVEHQPPIPIQQAVHEPASRRSIPTLKEGETSATIGGPMDQPDFELLARRQKDSISHDTGRSPLTTHRKLYNPNEPTPVKILTRPRTPKGSKAPQAASTTRIASPRRTPKASKKDKEKEQNKIPFQPKILQRPKESADGEAVPLPTASPAELSRRGSSEDEKQVIAPKAARTDPHTQTLLSLFGGNSVPPPTKNSQQSSRVVSPLSTSQVLSPKDEVPISAVDPISTRSRMSSMVSVGSVSTASYRPVPEKRTTAPSDKDFLLRYLNRMATDG